MEDWLTDSSSASPGDALPIQTDFESGCDSYFSEAGASVEVLDDMDGDGLPDLAIGSTIADSSTAGAVYIVLSSQLASLQTGDTLEDIAHLRLLGTRTDDNLGAALTSGDFDGDGLSDLVVSAIPDSSQEPGLVYIVFSADLPVNATTIEIQAMAGVMFSGPTKYDQSGTDLAAVPDLDGDGDDELLITAPRAESQRGVAYLVPGFYEVFGNYNIEDAFSTTVTPNATSAVRFIGGATDSLRSVAGAGDLNNDGEPDFLFGAPDHSNGTAARAGAAYVVYGGDAFWGDWWDPQTGAAREDVDLEASSQKQQKTAKSPPARPEKPWAGTWPGPVTSTETASVTS